MTTLLHVASLQLARGQNSEAVTTLWAGIGLIYQAGEQDSQKRRLSQLYGLLAHGYLELGNADASVQFFEKASKFLEPMASNVAAIVYEDVQARAFVDRLKITSADAYDRLAKRVDLEALPH